METEINGVYRSAEYGLSAPLFEEFGDGIKVTMFRKVSNSREKVSNAAQGPMGAPYEYCPRCDANLTLQKGYRNDLPYWICKGCGGMLINPEVDAEDDIAWICDKCGAMLNIQDGFKDNNGEWACTGCGYINIIDESERYASEDEFQAGWRERCFSRFAGKFGWPLHASSGNSK